MSDTYYSLSLMKNKYKRIRFLLPLSYFREVLNGVQNALFRYNVYNDIKVHPVSLFSRFFGGSNNQFINVLVLVADLENNVGAACLELLNAENPERLKSYGFRSHNNYDDFNINFNDNELDLLHNSIYDYQEESKILDANLYADENIDANINPNYLMQLSLSSNNSIPVHDDPIQEIIEYDNDDTVENDDFIKEELDLKPIDWSSTDSQTFISSNGSGSYSVYDKENYSEYGSTDMTDRDADEESYLELSEKFNNNKKNIVTYQEYDDEDEDDVIDDDYDCGDDNDNDDYFYLTGNTKEARCLPKPIKREIRHLARLNIPYEYSQITESSHEQFKVMKSDKRLINKQITAMVNARRRFINRRAATRCRNQKLQIKATLKTELKRLQNKLLQSQVNLTRACQNRNEMRDQFRTLQHQYLSHIRDSSDNNLIVKNWTVELDENNQCLVVREIRRSTDAHKVHCSVSNKS